MKWRFVNSLVLCIALFVFSSCEILEFSPYDNGVAHENINADNIESINLNTNFSDTLKFALISDTHISYDVLKKAIKEIGKQEDLKFIVCTGDITNSGLAREFEWYAEIIKDSKYPVITVIGNHEYRSNGLKIFNRMFGPTNMSFMYMGYKFIMFDDVVWENNNQPPRFDWLKEELEESDSPGVLLAHIAPCSNQLKGNYCEIFTGLISESNLILGLHGHIHSYAERTVGGVPLIIADNIGNREYYIIELFERNHKVLRVKF